MRGVWKSMSLHGKIALVVVLIYLAIAIIVPFLPLRDPSAYHAPPEDIFVPDVVDSYNFSEPVENLGVMEYRMFVITEKGNFIDYDLTAHAVLNEIHLEGKNFSRIEILHMYPQGVPIFHSDYYVYLYSPTSHQLHRYRVNGVTALYPIQEPFSPYRGFVAVNRTGMYAFICPYNSDHPSQEPAWEFKEENILGVHYSYNRIFVSTPSELFALNESGGVVWSLHGNFTSNPVFLPVYGNPFVYVAQGEEVWMVYTSNGSVGGDVRLDVNVTQLNYYGQSLYAYSPNGVFGKVNLLGSGFSWEMNGIERYAMSPFIDGMGAITDEGKLIFVLIGDGTVQWGAEGDFRDVFIGEQRHVPYLFTTLGNGTSVRQYSYSGRLITPLPPSEKYPLGTDSAGRDVLSQLLWGFRMEMYIAIVSGLLVLLLGTVWGLVAGYFSGLPDDILLMLTDILLFIPAIGYAALMIFLFGIVHHIEATIVASVLALSPLEARAVRNYTKMVKEKPYVESARLMGASPWRVIFVHILPEVKGISLVYALSATTMALLLEVGVSFLGFGNYTIPTWGWMLTNAYFTGYLDRWWLVIPPLLALFILVYSLYLLSQEMYASEYIESLESRSFNEE